MYFHIPKKWRNTVIGDSRDNDGHKRNEVTDIHFLILAPLGSPMLYFFPLCTRFRSITYANPMTVSLPLTMSHSPLNEVSFLAFSALTGRERPLLSIVSLESG